MLFFNCLVLGCNTDDFGTPACIIISTGFCLAVAFGIFMIVMCCIKKKQARQAAIAPRSVPRNGGWTNIVLVLCKVARADPWVITIITQGSAHTTLCSTRITLGSTSGYGGGFGDNGGLGHGGDGGAGGGRDGGDGGDKGDIQDGGNGY